MVKQLINNTLLVILIIAIPTTGIGMAFLDHYVVHAAPTDLKKRADDLPLPPAETSLEGWYTLTGKTSEGITYAGMILIQSHGKGYHLHWLTNGGGRESAVAIRDGNKISIGMAGNVPLVCYGTISTDGINPVIKVVYRAYSGLTGEEEYIWLRAVDSKEN